jgi:DNA (cytosine-5)-methyltransferase 1
MAPSAESRQENPVAVYGKIDGRRLWTRRDGSELRAPSTIEVAREAMGIGWMGWDELREAIPPHYTEWIGAQMLRVAV